MKNKKTFTLIELIMASSLVFVIVLAAFSIDNVARDFYMSSVRKAEVTNEANYVMEFIVKRLRSATANIPGYNSDFRDRWWTFSYEAEDGDPIDPNDDYDITLTISTPPAAGGHTDIRADITGGGGSEQVILATNRLVSPAFEIIPNIHVEPRAGHFIKSHTVKFVMAYDAKRYNQGDRNPRTNPTVSIETTVYSENMSMGRR